MTFGLPLGHHHRVHDFRFCLFVAFIRPDTKYRQVVLQPDHRVTERPGIGFGFGSIGGRIIGCGMRTDAVGDMFDERWAEVATSALGCPFGHGIDGEIIVAVDPERRNAEAETTRSECSGPAAGYPLEG